jgi:hypothetical protein
VVWSWRSSDHVAVDETTFPLDEIELPEGDGVIISARHLDAVLRIRRSDGGIDWRLGGTQRRRASHPPATSAGSSRRAGWPTARSGCTTTAHAAGGRRGRCAVITELAADGATVLTLRLAAGFSYRAYPVSSSLLSRAALRARMDAMAPR